MLLLTAFTSTAVVTRATTADRTDANRLLSPYAVAIAADVPNAANAPPKNQIPPRRRPCCR